MLVRLCPRLPQSRQHRRTILVADTTAKAATEDAAQRRTKTIAADTVEKEVGAECNVEQQVTHRLRYLPAHNRRLSIILVL